jgi:hypothetical protein
MVNIFGIIIHGALFLIGLFGISVSVAAMNTLLAIGSIMCLFAVGYSFYEFLKVATSSNPTSN